jgi:hypothetical protein
MLKAVVENAPLVPATVTEKVAVPDAEGVPLIIPPPLKFKPAGKVPLDMDHE